DQAGLDLPSVGSSEPSDDTANVDNPGSQTTPAPIDNETLVVPRAEAGYMKTATNRVSFSGFVIEGVDVATFAQIDDVYAKDKNRVYFRGIPLDQVLVSTFKVLKYGYSTDGKSVYFQRFRILDANPKGFIPLNEWYAKDAYRVYFGAYVVTNADAANFAPVSLDMAIDKNWIYLRDSKAWNRKSSRKHLGQNYWLVDGAIYFQKALIPEADIDSFQVLSRFSAKDKNFVYRTDKVMPTAKVDSFRVLSEKFSVDSSQVYFQEIVIPGADPSTFIPISDSYGRDARAVFKETKAIVGALPNSFEIIGIGYSKDENAVYFNLTLLPGITPKGFEILGRYYVRDQAVIFWQNRKLAVTQPPSFTVFHSGFAKDSEKVYFNGTVDSGIQASSFVDTGFGYFKDQSGLYKYVTSLARMVRLNFATTGIDLSNFTPLNPFYGKTATSVIHIRDSWANPSDAFEATVMATVDRASFQVFGKEPYAKDRTGVYSGHYLMKEADVSTFQVLKEPYSKDAFRVYFKSQVLPNALPSNFQIIDNHFSKSGTTLYLRYYPIVGLDARTAQIIDCPESRRPDPLTTAISNCYLNDGKSVFNGFNLIQGADPSTFSVLNSDLILARDADQVFREAHAILGADPGTFEVIDSSYFKDQNSVYYGDTKIQADPATFTLAANGYYRDKNSVFYLGKPLVGLDVHSFSLVGRNRLEYLKDKSKVFYGGSELVGADFSSIQVLDYQYAQDKSGFFLDGVRTTVSPSGRGLVGAITAVESLSDGSLLVTGWGCGKGSTIYKKINFYAGGPLGRGTAFGNAVTSLPGPAASTTACGLAGDFGFETKIHSSFAKLFSGQLFYAQFAEYDIWTPLAGGGKFVIP
ncbi:MAG: DKNYY domain-containing protein, partial [Pseudobdellovibrionaceae bacterium]